MAIESPSLCTARAKQAFEPEDQSLRFKEGDIIEVFSMPQSGLWEGSCNSTRGWFPSSYVHVIKEGDSSKRMNGFQNLSPLRLFDDQLADTTPSRDLDLESDNIPIQATTDGPYKDSDECLHFAPIMTGESLFDDHLQDTNSQDETQYQTIAPHHHWTLHIIENNHGRFFFNQRTGELQALRPLDGASESASDEHIYSDHDSYYSMTSSSGVDYTMSDAFSVDSERQMGRSESDVNCSHSSQLYKTEEKELEINGSKSISPNILPAQKESVIFNEALPQVLLPLPENDSVTWDKIFVRIALNIHKINTAIRTGDGIMLAYSTSEAVEAVRYMLFSSGTIEKDSLHIKTDAILRAHYRTMMASLSKLVLSVRIHINAPEDKINNVLSDSNEFLIATRNFINTCMDIPITLHSTDPSPASSVQSVPPISYAFQNNDFSGSVDEFASTMQESILAMNTSLSSLYSRNESYFSLMTLLFTQFRNLLNQTSKFFALVDCVPPMEELAEAKQELRDSLALLFYQMQTTDTIMSSSEGKIGIEGTLKSSIEAIQSICACVYKSGYEPSADLKSTSSKLSMQEQGSLLGSKEVEKRSADEPIVFAEGVPEEFLPQGVPAPSSSGTNNGRSSTGRSTPSVAAAESGDTRLESNKRQTAGKRELLPRLSQELSTNSSAKLKKFFGDDVPNVIPVAPNSLSNRKPWYLQYDYDQTEIIFNMDGEVKGGTLSALVERLTLHDYLDMNFINTFLLTYRSFCTSIELVHLLEGRYRLQAPEGLTAEELDTWNQKKLKLIRLRVFSVLKNWLEQYYYEDDSVILKELLLFTNSTIRSTLSFSAHQLERLINKRLEAEGQGEYKKMVLTLPDPPEPTLPRNLKKIRLMDIDTLELARQLTIIDFKLYSSITPVECLVKTWSRTDEKSNIATNIRASIEYCNQVTFWVSSVILSQPDLKKRSSLIKYWVQVAEKCRRLNNFNSCMAVLSVFDNSSIGRLKRTWEMVGARTKQTLSQIRRLMGANRNFNEYRILIHSINPPCIPFLGIYLQDLTFIEDGNKNFLKASKELINFDKRTKTAAVIREIQQYQSSPYQLKPVEELQEFIQANIQNDIDEEKLYKKSLSLEPREDDNEKITRLLHESGFL